MITGSVLFAKAIEFIVTKLISKKIDLAIDKKNRAAHAFWDLYNSLIEVDKLLAKVISVFTEACENQKHIVFSKKLVELAPEIDSCSKNFFVALHNTISVIQILDPNIAILLAGIRDIKGSYLSLWRVYEAFGLNVDFQQLHPFKKIDYITLDENVTKLELDVYYGKISNRDSAIRTHEELMKVIEQGIIKGEIEPKDFVKICSFSKELITYKKKLGEAREALRIFISKSFSIEDLLFY